MSHPMTYPRSHLVDKQNGGIYHCWTRCVRRAWLVGEDPLTGVDHSHRSGWIEQRMLELADVFSVQLFGYAVMSNHYHLLLNVDPKAVAAWSDDEVARRWISVSKCKTPAQVEGEHAALLADPERLLELRERLGDLSYFMRFLNESIARRANAEDGVTGKFWGDRFGSSATLDNLGVLTCLMYIDLNPFRAGMVKHPHCGPHTSINRRIRKAGKTTAPLASIQCVGMTLKDYLTLLEHTAGVDRPSSSGAGPPTHIEQLGCDTAWLSVQVNSHRHHYRAYGSVERLIDYAKSVGQRWIKGYRTRAA
jgi:hypothetical protein